MVANERARGERVELRAPWEEEKASTAAFKTIAHVGTRIMG